YGYEFAQAAELMRDYEGWATEDFQRFQRWMLDVWYPGCIHFLRNRNGTWENTGKWWQAPGHYWSNWGLCNALAVISIGILCDDVFIYNQGMSFIKYDQCGTFTDPRTANPILNDGLTEFWGNLIVTTAEWEKETGAYGKVGQMNESGRDTGHAAMALGLAVDIAHTAWNQGDDLFAYMNHRLAAGIEYIAAQCQEVPDLPWTNYHYANNGYYYTDSRAWLMTGPALGAQIRAYWGTVIGHYEGIKGVRMPFSEWAYSEMGIDGGGIGGTSGGYDHLGYSVLMNTYGDEDFYLNPTPPVELQPQIQYNGKTIDHNELGGLTNTFTTTAVNNRAVAPGTQLTLVPRLPENEENTGLWQWNTGETTQEITVTADRSFIYRVTYTAANGTTSTLCFPVAVSGDTHDTQVTTTVSSGGVTAEDSIIVVKKGASVTLTLNGLDGYGNYGWENNKTTASITLTNVKETQTVSGYFQNQGGRKTWRTFTIYVNSHEADNSRIAADGKYRIHHVPSDTYLTNAGGHAALLPLDNTMSAEQAWELTFAKSAAKYYLV
ncbi:MAG: alginate lyase family protein, partial [Bacteroidaceae bacterium]|nr:alginate lyase family protein [Bacteroidaceae bacterium]